VGLVAALLLGVSCAALAPLPEGNAFVRGLLGAQRQREEAVSLYTYDVTEVREQLRRSDASAISRPPCGPGRRRASSRACASRASWSATTSRRSAGRSWTSAAPSSSTSPPGPAISTWSETVSCAASPAGSGWTRQRRPSRRSRSATRPVSSLGRFPAGARGISQHLIRSGPFRSVPVRSGPFRSVPAPGKAPRRASPRFRSVSASPSPRIGRLRVLLLLVCHV